VARKQVAAARKRKQDRNKPVGAATQAHGVKIDELKMAIQVREVRMAKKREEEEEEARRAKELKDEVDKKLQYQQLEQLGMRNDFLALQAEFQGPFPLGVVSVHPLGSFSSGHQADGEEIITNVKEGASHKIVDPFSHEYAICGEIAYHWGTKLLCCAWLLGRDDLEMSEEEAQLYNFHSYAISRFSQHTSGLFRKRAVTPDQMLCFSMVTNTISPASLPKPKLDFHVTEL
jgi:hypothetical protein